MSGPFPGMDPCLEDPAYWHGMHNRLIFCASEALNIGLPPGYVADIEERLYVVEAERSIYPDVALLRVLPQVMPRQESRVSESGTALLDRAAPHGVVSVTPVETHEWYVTIRTTNKPRRIVTIIEILSPANKAAGSVGRREYLQKQQEILQSDTHLLEIYLLRQGAHTVAAPLASLQQRGTWDYLACLHRSAQRYEYGYWLNRVTEPLPPLQVPLMVGEQDTVLDLQAVFDRAYNSGRYAQGINYGEDPRFPLQAKTRYGWKLCCAQKGFAVEG